MWIILSSLPTVRSGFTVCEISASYCSRFPGDRPCFRSAFSVSHSFMFRRLSAFRFFPHHQPDGVSRVLFCARPLNAGCETFILFDKPERGGVFSWLLHLLLSSAPAVGVFLALPFQKEEI